MVLLRQDFRRAVKEHWCVGCCNTIPAGWLYHVSSWEDCGSIHETKLCPRCYYLWRMFVDDEWGEGEIAEFYSTDLSEQKLRQFIVQQKWQYGIVRAVDKKGNKFYLHWKIDSPTEEEEKAPLPDSTKEYGYYGPIVHMDPPASYYINSLLKDHPWKRPFCIDAAGRNHKGSSVFIPTRKINEFLKDWKWAQEENSTQ